VMSFSLQISRSSFCWQYKWSSTYSSKIVHIMSSRNDVFYIYVSLTWRTSTTV
jgi:hypothetical protein